MGDIHLNIVVLKATNLKCESKWRSQPNGYVTIGWVLGSQPQMYRTQEIKSTKSPVWDESFRLFSQSMDSTISFSMFDKGLGSPNSYGTVERTIHDLLAAPLLDINFPSDGPVLSIKAQKDDSALSDTLCHVQHATQEFSGISDQIKITGSTYISLGSVVNSLAKLMEIADSVAQIHPFINLTWKIASSVYKVVKDQLDRDRAIHDLAESMVVLYGFTVPLEDMRRAHKELDGTLVDIIKQILNQTAECLLFIQEYSGKGFAGRSVEHTFSPTDARIKTFKEAFAVLGNSLDTGLSVNNLMVSMRMESGVQAMALKDKLDPAKMEWTGRPVCHPHTRLDIQRTITEWIVDPEASTKVLWITSPVGAGKSTLATTVANMYAETRRLGAFLFFNRDVKERSDPTNFIRTLAYELSRYDNRIHKAIKFSVDQNSHITQMQPDAQFRELIRIPLTKAASVTSADKSLADEGPIVIIIDSLDECGDESTRKQLLKVLAKEMANLPRVVRVVITSRFSPDIRTAFDKEVHIKHHQLEVLPHDNDIRVYMESQFRDIEEKSLLGPGELGEDKLSTLVSRADGLFIWASTACKYIDCHDPVSALDDLLQVPVEGFHKGLDDLYGKALNGAGDWNNVRFRQAYQLIMGTILVAKNPMTTKTIDEFLGLKLSSQRFLSPFASLIHQAPNEPVRALHNSFSEFISDPKRCKDSMWLINVSEREYHSAANCIAQMTKVFARPRQFMLAKTYNADYDEAVIYSCSYWIHHVIAVREGPERKKIAAAVFSFMKVHTLHWLEVMSVLQISRSTTNILEQLYVWAVDDVDMAALVYDVFRFAMFFAETIAEHPALVAQGALPFAPLESKLYQLFHDHRELPTVMGGYQRKWSPSLRVFHRLDTRVICVSFSPDMTKVVSTGSRLNDDVDDLPAGSGYGERVRCWDVAAGTEATPSINVLHCSIAQFSPDGTQIWVANGKGDVFVLDAGTGDYILRLTLDKWLKRQSSGGSQSSPSQRKRRPSDTEVIPKGGAPSGPPRSIQHIKSDDDIPRSRGPWHLDISTTHDAAKGCLQSLQSSLRAPILPPEPGDLVAESEINGHFTRAAFSSDGRWVIFGDSSGQLYVVSREAEKQAYDILVECSELAPRGVLRMFPSIVFSPSNEIFAAGAGNGNIYTWSIASGEKLLELTGHATEIILLSFSPNSKELYSASEDGNVRTWDPHTGDAILSVAIDIEGISNFQPMAFSTDGRVASTSTDGTIQIWDVKTGDEVGPVLQGHFNAVSSMSFSQDGSKLVSGAFKNNIQIWDVSVPGKGGLISRHDRPPHEVAFSPSGLMVRSWRPDETKFWSTVTGRELKMVRYDKSADFSVAEIDDDSNRDEEESALEIKETTEKHMHGQDTVMTSTGDIVTLVDPLPKTTISELEKVEWEAAIAASSPGTSNWVVSLSGESASIIYYHSQSISTMDDVTSYKTDGQVIWRLPLEFRHRSNDVRPNFISFGIWDGRVFVIHIPEKFVARDPRMG